MSAPEILAAIAHWPLAHALAKADHLVTAALQVVHILGFLLLLSSVSLISLRLLNLVLTAYAVPQLAGQTLRLLWLGAALAIPSGVLLFLTGPAHYYYNGAFDLKMLLLCAALVAQLTLQQWVVRRDPAPVALQRASALLGLLLWFGVTWAGRAIGFV